MLKNAAKVRICDHFFDDGVSAAGIDVRNAVPQSVIGKTLTFCLEMTFFFMEESLPICDKILKVSDLGVIYCRVINLRNDTVP